MCEQFDEGFGAGERAFDAFGSDDRGCCRHHGVRRIASLACSFRRHQRTVADKVDFGGNRDVEHGAVVFGRDLMHQRQREVGFERLERKVENRETVNAGDLRLGVHDGRAGLVLHVLARDHGANLRLQRLDLHVVGRERFDHRQGKRVWKLDALVVHDPRLQR